MKSARITFCYAVVYTIVLTTLITLPGNTRGDDPPQIQGAFFYSPDCPCTNRSIEVLNELQGNYTDFEVIGYNVDLEDNWSLSLDFLDAYNVWEDERNNYPFVFIGDYYFANEKITNENVSPILDSYEGQNVSLWPEWGDVKWTTQVRLFYNSTTTQGLNAFYMIQSLDATNLLLAIYDTYDSPYQSTRQTLFLEAYNSSLVTSNATVFIGDDFLAGDNVTEENVEAVLLKYSGVNSQCRNIIEPTDYGDICVIVFSSEICGECELARLFLGEMEAKYPDLNIKYKNILEDDNEVLKQTYAKHYGVPRGDWGTLMVFIGDKAFTNLDDLEGGFEEQVIRYKDGVPLPDIEPDEEIVIETFESFNVFAVMAAGLIDGINPCAFATLIFFISYLSASKRSEKQILFVGIIFVLGVFITYMLLGIGFVRGLETFGGGSTIFFIIYLIAGLVALIFGIYSLYDYKKISMGKTREMVLKLPRRLKNLIHWIIEKQVNMKYFIVFAFITGVLISIFEFICTGQVYLPTIIYIMGVPGYKGQAFLYLFLYNLMFVVPLILIFIAAYFGVSDERLKAVLRKHVGLIKILTAVLFFSLAIYMLVRVTVMFL